MPLVCNDQLNQRNVGSKCVECIYKYYNLICSAFCDATCTWSGILPQRNLKPSGYSSKVFLGGVPWDITESLLVATFKQFGPIRVEWPGKDHYAGPGESNAQPKGYVYIVFESEKQVTTNFIKFILLVCVTFISSKINPSLSR